MRLRHALLGVVLLGSAAAGACGSEPGSTFTTPTEGGTADGTTTVDGEAVPLPFIGDDGSFQDFPSTPIIDTPDGGAGLPPNIADLFNAAPTSPSGGPCLIEPEIGSKYPRNWLRPRFRWVADQAFAPLYADAGPDAGDASMATSPANVFEIKLEVANQPVPLRVYTTNPSWTMPKTMWDGLRQNSADVAMTLTVRGGVWDGSALTQVSVGSTGPLSIAPVDAPGTIVYWTSTGSGSASGFDAVLKGFRVGDETVAEVLRPAQLAPATSAGDGGPYRCLGCHSSTPDGLYAAVSARPESSGGGSATRIELGGVNGDAGAPSFLTPTAQALLERDEQEMPVFTPAHYAPGDRIAITMLMTTPNTGHEIVWTDLEANSAAQDAGWGIFARTGDTRKAALASASHDGNTIVYVSSAQTDTAGTIVKEGEIYTIPYNNRQGGPATALPGANEPGMRQFYPSYSPDDKFVVFDRSPNTTGSSYNDPRAEIHIIPSAGGTTTRLAANDPPACAGTKSPGVHNGWPRWSPKVRSASGKDYYFLVFSSTRATGPARYGARLFVTPIVVTGTTIETFGALYLWNQPDNEDNHSPAWDELQIPPVGPPK